MADNASRQGAFRGHGMCVSSFCQSFIQSLAGIYVLEGSYHDSGEREGIPKKMKIFKYFPLFSSIQNHDLVRSCFIFYTSNVGKIYLVLLDFGKCVLYFPKLEKSLSYFPKFGIIYSKVGGKNYAERGKLDEKTPVFVKKERKSLMVGETPPPPR